MFLLPSKNEFFRNLSVSNSEKLKFWTNFWMTFSGFARKVLRLSLDDMITVLKFFSNVGVIHVTTEIHMMCGHVKKYILQLNYITENSCPKIVEKSDLMNFNVGLTHHQVHIDLEQI